MTVYAMSSTIGEVKDNAINPYMSESITLTEALSNTEHSFKEFMIRHTREEDLTAIISMAEKKYAGFNRAS